MNTQAHRSNGTTPDTHVVARLRKDARYARERRDLYRAKTYGPRATSPDRLRELERQYEQAAERLARAELKQAADTPTREETP